MKQYHADIADMELRKLNSEEYVYIWEKDDLGDIFGALRINLAYPEFSTYSEFGGLEEIFQGIYDWIKYSGFYVHNPDKEEGSLYYYYQDWESAKTYIEEGKS